jgi:hypothetical protein
MCVFVCMYIHYVPILVHSDRLTPELMKQSVTIMVLKIWNVIICEQLCFCVRVWNLVIIRRTKDRNVFENWVLMSVSGRKRAGGAVSRRVGEIAWWDISWFLLHAGFLLLGWWSDVTWDRLVMWHALRDKRNLYGVLMPKPNVKRRPFGRPKCTWENNVGILLKWTL